MHCTDKNGPEFLIELVHTNETMADEWVQYELRTKRSARSTDYRGAHHNVSGNTLANAAESIDRNRTAQFNSVESSQNKNFHHETVATARGKRETLHDLLNTQTTDEQRL